MSAMDIGSLLGGGGGGPSGPGDILGGGGAPPDLSGGGPPSPQDPSQQTGGDADSLLADTIDSLKAYIAAEGSDDVDTATAAQCLAKLQGIKAGQQKDHEAAMGTTSVHKGMTKALSAGY